MIQLIVGLANPGKEYAETRHNAGAWFVDEITPAAMKLRYEAKFHGLYGQIKTSSDTCHLLIPTTFMNLSGRAVSACMKYHKLTPENILVAHDDIDIPVGDIRLKFDGGDGGHNGLKDIIKMLGSKQFYRLRIGVGHPGRRPEVVDYVLNKPSKADKQKIDEALGEAVRVVPLLLAGEMQKAMQDLHTRDK